MIIENINTGQRFEIADGAHFPESAYRVVKPKPTATSDKKTDNATVAAKSKKPATRRKKKNK